MACELGLRNCIICYMTDLFCWILCDQPPGNFKTFPSIFHPKKTADTNQPTYVFFAPTFVTTTMIQNYSQRVTCDMPVICLMFVLFAYSYTAFLMVDSFAASPIHSWDFCKKKKGLWSKLSHLFFQSLPDYWRARTAQNTVYLSSTSHPDAKYISFQISSMHRKQNFKIVFGF